MAGPVTGQPSYRSKRMRAIHGLPPRAGIPAAKWTPEQTPGALFQPWRLTHVLDLCELYDPELSQELTAPSARSTGGKRA